VPNTGAAYSAFLNWDRHNGFSTVFTKSTDHGQTWTEPVHVYDNVSWTDKAEITSSASGTSTSPGTGRKAATSTSASPRQGRDLGERRRGEGAPGRVLRRRWLLSEFYTGQTSVVGDAPGHLVFAYEGPTTDAGPQRVYVSTSTNGGRTWSAGAPLSEASENATQPRLASAGGGNVRIWYMETAGHDPDAWNVWYRSSSNGGASWSSPVKISDAPASAAGYIGDDGFAEIYGDCGEIAVTNTGKTVAIWGARGSATRAPAAAGSTSSADLLAPTES
jgi:hypothetical protein